jgi:hypothetical protein
MTKSCNWTDAEVALLSSVYDLQCVSRMNALYYERRLSQLQNHSFWMEVVTAATASGSGLAALTLFATIPGRWAWQAMALVAAVVALHEILRLAICRTWDRTKFENLPVVFLTIAANTRQRWKRDATTGAQSAVRGSTVGSRKASGRW